LTALLVSFCYGLHVSHWQNYSAYGMAYM